MEVHKFSVLSPDGYPIGSGKHRGPDRSDLPRSRDGSKSADYLIDTPSTEVAGNKTRIQITPASENHGRITLLDALTGEGTKVLNQQQNDPDRSVQSSSHGQSSSQSGEPKEASLADTTSIWTGQKKTKVQSTPRPSVNLHGIARGDGEHSDTVMDNQQEQQIEGLNWGFGKLKYEISYYGKQLNREPPSSMDSWVYYDEETQLAELNQRLAIHRIIAHEVSVTAQASDAASIYVPHILILEGGQPPDDTDQLRHKYPPPALEAEGYFKYYERSFGWYFDPEYCRYDGLQDYQRLVLSKRNSLYLDWDYYRRTNSTYEFDREFVKFYEKLAKETEVIVNRLIDGKLKWDRMRYLVCYQALKIATGFPNMYRPLVYSCFHEYVSRIHSDYSCYNKRANLFFEIWKRVAKRKMRIKKALEQIYEEGIPLSYEMEYKLSGAIEGSCGSIEAEYEICFADIDEKVPEKVAYEMIMEANKNKVPRLLIHYDYVKKKLDVAQEIRLIPPES